MKALGHYLIYQLANAQILQLRNTKKNKKTLQKKMENKRRFTTKTFLSDDTTNGLNHLQHQNQVKNSIVILKIASQ